MDSKILIAIIAAVIVIVAAAAILLSGGGGENNNGGNDEPTGVDDFSLSGYVDLSKDYLAVFGNANGDTSIDSSDVTYVENLIKDGTINYWKDPSKYGEYHLADANNDRIINSDDVAYIKTMINGTAKTVYFECQDEKIESYTVSEKVYLIPVQRTYGRTAVMIANASENITIVGGDEQMWEDEFTDAFDHTNVKNVGKAGGSSVSTEALSQIAKNYTDGNVVVMTGKSNYYCTDYEDKLTGTGICFARGIAWEGSALTGLLTWSYIFDGVGNNSTTRDGTAWGNAKAFETWYNKYLGTIEDYIDSLDEDDKTTVLVSYYGDTINGVSISNPYGISENGGRIRGKATSDYLNSVLAGGNNVIDEVTGDQNEMGNVIWDCEKLASICQKVDVDVFMFRNALYVGSNSDDFISSANDLAKALTGFLPSDTAIWVSTYNLTGIPTIVDIAVLAKVLCPDNATISGWDLETIWNEYLGFYGVSTTSNLAYSNMALCIESPTYTTTA